MLGKYLFAVFAAGLSLVGLAQAEDPKRIVFAAGPKDHGAPGRHEYEKDLATLKACLDSATNVRNISTVLYPGKVPAAAELKNAAVIVLESSGDRTPTEHHVLFPQDATTDHKGYDTETSEQFRQIDAMMKKGAGAVVFHYATYVNNETGRKYFLDWVGGFYESGVSKTIVSEWSVAPTNAQHPVLRGVQPWTVREEFYVNLRTPDDPRRTPLLMATPANGGDPSLVSWAIEREGGGRGFVMTGVDWHKNLLNESYRRVLVNGILWAARVEVPVGGVQCKIPEDSAQ